MKCGDEYSLLKLSSKSNIQKFLKAKDSDTI